MYQLVFTQEVFLLGVLGGGQLGKMILQETSRLDIQTAVLDPSSFSPCKGHAQIFEVGDLKDFETVYRFGKMCNVLTIEIENVNVDALERLEEEGINLQNDSGFTKRLIDALRGK